MKKKVDTSCSMLLVTASLALLGFVFCRTVKFFQRPDALQEIGEILLVLLKAAGLCLGAAVVLFALIVIISLVSSRLVRKGHNYSLRVYPIELQIPTIHPLPPDLPEAPGQETIHPLFLQTHRTNYGLHLTPHPQRSSWKWFPADNAAHFNLLSDNHPGRLIIPTYSINLYYRVISQQGNLGFTTGPSDAPGFSGDLPTSLDGQALEIIIIYTSICDPKKLNLNIARAQPLKLQLVVLDKNGQEDPAATGKFYNELWNTKKPTEGSNDDDESWMYRSRPTMPW